MDNNNLADIIKTESELNEIKTDVFSNSKEEEESISEQVETLT